MDNNLFPLIRASQNGDTDALNMLVSENDKLIWSVVRHFSNGPFETEDLFQIGAIGFIKAVKKFDFSKEVAFSTYAVPMMIGEIKRFMRDDGILKVSRSIKEQGMKIRALTHEYMIKTGKNMSVSEIAKQLNIDIEEVASSIAATEIPVSIFQPAGNGKNDLTLAETIKTNTAFDEKILDKIAITSAASKLPLREQKILQMRYYENRTQSEIAAMLGISQVQVSRLEKKILSKLKEEIS